jgi:hypothetical protein
MKLLEILLAPHTFIVVLRQISCIFYLIFNNIYNS